MSLIEKEGRDLKKLTGDQQYPIKFSEKKSKGHGRENESARKILTQGQYFQCQPSLRGEKSTGHYYRGFAVFQKIYGI